MSNPKDHHYLPRFLLQEWATNGQLCEFKRAQYTEKVESKGRSPKSTGYEKLLYSVTGFGEDWLYAAEKNYYSPLDNAAAIAHQVLLGKQSKSDWQPDAWASFVISLMFRNPGDIDKLDQAFSDPKSWLPSSHRDFATIEGLKDNEALRSFAVQKAITNQIDNSPVLPLLKGMHWEVLNIPQSSENYFCLSDHPLIIPEPIRSNCAFVALPISPYRLFCAANLPEAILGLRKLTPETITKNTNIAVVRAAKNYVYARDHETYKELISEHFPSSSGANTATAQHYFNLIQ